MASTYEPIATQTLGSAAASVTFSSISGSYTDLELVVSASGTADQAMRMQFNGDTSALYSDTYLYADGGFVVSGRHSGQTNIKALGYFGNAFIGTSRIVLNNYSNPNIFKSVIARGGTASGVVIGTVGLWRNNAAITSLILYPESSGNFAVGSTFTLYGIKAA